MLFVNNDLYEVKMQSQEVLIIPHEGQYRSLWSYILGHEDIQMFVHQKPAEINGKEYTLIEFIHRDDI